ncbi:hypothetical protein OAK19_03470 [Aureispira]|nr:hypothetical protein [Aureispira sp.]
MPTLEELQDRLVQYRTALSQMRVRYEADGITSDEQEDLDELQDIIDDVEQRIEATRQRQSGASSSGDGSSANTPISYTQTSQRTWWWQLEDADFWENDLGARFELNVQFGKIVRGSYEAWIIDGVTASSQTHTGITLEPAEIASVYKEVGGNLIVELTIQIKFATANVDVSRSNSVSFSLEGGERSEVGASLPIPGTEGGTATAGRNTSVQAGFSFEKSWVRSQNLPGSSHTITRRFKCTNNGNGSCRITLDYENTVNPSTIDDVPELDWFNIDGADWEMSDNNSAFAGSL